MVPWEGLSLFNRGTCHRLNQLMKDCELVRPNANLASFAVNGLCSVFCFLDTWKVNKTLGLALCLAILFKHLF